MNSEGYVTPPRNNVSDVTRLAAGLTELKADHRLSYLKLGTEAEALSFEEIGLLRRIANEGVPGGVDIVGKIGGPEARNDLHQLARLGVRGFVAPMVESPYALKNYLTAVHSVLGPDTAVTVGINIETVDAVARLDAMLEVPGATEMDFVNVGRSDLAASVGGVVGDAQVTDLTCSVLERVQALGLSGHVGGCVTEETLGPVLARVLPDGFHTRFLAFGLSPGVAVSPTVRRALEVEIDLLTVLANADVDRSAMHRARIEVTRSRMTP